MKYRCYRVFSNPNGDYARKVAETHPCIDCLGAVGPHACLAMRKHVWPHCADFIAVGETETFTIEEK